MRVLKRNGEFQDISFDKVLVRLKHLSTKLNLDQNDIVTIAQKVCARIYDGVKTSELDKLAANLCISLSTEKIEYAKLASYLVISNHHKDTLNSFSDKVKLLYHNKNGNNEHSPLVSKALYKLVNKYGKKIDKEIDYNRDYDFDFFGFKTLERAYMLRTTDKIVERIQDIFMRVSLGLHGENIDNAFKSYHLMSQKYFTHATPTLFHSGTERPQLLSCFLMGTDDSVEGMYKNITDCALIQKWAGGIGVHISNIRSSGSIIASTNGKSNGIIPMLKVYNSLCKHINQSGKRQGSIAMYLEPHHPDILDFLELRKNHGNEDQRARDLFTAVWLSDLFMKKVEKDEDWCLFDPNECKGLSDSFSEEYEKLYNKYFEEKKYRKIIPARTVWRGIIDSQIETGTPYILFKDAANKKSNQQNLGTIKSSNLCVSGDTNILTSDGYYKIKELDNKNIRIWNGKEFTNTKIIKTGCNKDLIKIKFSNGTSIKCTPYHKFYLKNNDKVDASMLNIGDSLIKYDLPIIDNKNNKFKYAYTHGLFCADGTYTKFNDIEKFCDFKKKNNTNYCMRHQYYEKRYINPDNTKCCAKVNQSKPLIFLYDTKKELVKYIDIRKDSSPFENSNRTVCTLPEDISKKFNVPINYSIDIKLRWLEGLIDGDGCLLKNNNSESIQITSIHKNFLKNVLYLLQTIGVNTKIKLMRKEGLRKLPDENRNLKNYMCKNCYRITISPFYVNKLFTLGLKPKRIKLSNHKANRCAEQFIKVENIIELNEKEDTYCFKEEKRGMGMFNGILTGQCAEILEYSDHKEYACCTLASIGLPKFVDTENNKFDFKQLEDVVEILVQNLNNVIDINYYPVPETSRSNFRHRPIGIGVQGLADVFIILDLEFDSDEAKKLNEEIFETIYYASMKQSCKIAKERKEIMLRNLDGYKTGQFHFAKNDMWCDNIIVPKTCPNDDVIRNDLKQIKIIKMEYDVNEKYLGAYQSFEGSPLSQGKFQFDLWGKKASKRYNWNELRKDITENGVRNSLAIALMPTASTSQILGNNECIEPYTSNIYSRRTIAGDFVVVNKHLIEKCNKLGIWNKEIKDKVIAYNGSVQYIDEIPDKIKKLFRTAWELKQKSIMELAISRGPFVCQTQSMNLFFEEPTYKTLTGALFYAWREGLKTGVYYVRSRPKIQAQQFTLDPDFIKKIKEQEQKTFEVCESCSA